MTYKANLLGVRSVLSKPDIIRRQYLAWFGIPDVRTHLTGAYLLPTMVRLRSGSILDVGCGGGLLTCLVATTLPESRVCAWDRDAAAVDYAQRLAAAHGVGNAHFAVVDAEHSAYDAEARFDAITALAVLQFVADVPGTLAKFRRQLLPGGHLILQVPAATPPVSFFMRARVLGNRLPDFHEMRGGFSEAECRQLIEAAGLELVDLTPIIKRPTRVAKDLFYLARSVHRSLAAVVCPLLNWITVRDPGYRGAGAGYFIVARKPLS